MGDVPFRNVSSMCDFLEEIARHKTFSAHFLEEIGRHKTISAHFLRKSLATKLFRLISSGNRPPQTFSAHFLRKSAAHLLTHFLRKSLDGLPLISSGNRWMTYIELDVILTFLRRTHVFVDAHGKAPF